MLIIPGSNTDYSYIGLSTKHNKKQTVGMSESNLREFARVIGANIPTAIIKSYIKYVYNI